MVLNKKNMSGLESRAPVTDKQSPLLSVVIPTRNRVKYAKSAIESILTFTTDPRLELVVQDNTDSHELEQFVKENIIDKRLCYNYTPPPLSYIQNFNQAIALSKGEYVCIIGDDDGINPEIMSAACWAKEKDIDVINVMHNPFYLWPDTNIKSTLFTKIEGGLLKIFEPFDGSFRAFNVTLNVKKYLRATVPRSKIQFARLYHGIVRRSCLEQIFIRTGTYLKGLSPDICAAMALSEVVKKSFTTNYPLTISGLCNASATVQSNTAQDDRAQNRAIHHIHLRANKEYKWDVLVPMFSTPETIWADSALATLRSLGRGDLVADFNVPRLSAFCFARYGNYRIEALKGMYKGCKSLHKNQILSTLLFFYYLLTDTPLRFAQRTYNRLRVFYKGDGVVRIRELNDMNAVTKALISYLKKEGKSVDKFLNQ